MQEPDKKLSPFIADVAFEYALLKQLRLDAGSASMSWKDAKDIASRGVTAIEKLGYGLAGAIHRSEDLTSRVERLEAALREVATSSYEPGNLTIAIQTARAALGDATSPPATSPKQPDRSEP